MSDDQARVNAAYKHYCYLADIVTVTHSVAAKMHAEAAWESYERARLETGLEITQ